MKRRVDVHVAPMSKTRPFDLVKLSSLVLGVPTHYRDVPQAVRQYLRRIPRHGLRGVRVAVFDTRYRMTRWLSGSAARKLVRHERGLGGSWWFHPRASSSWTGRGPLVEGEVERAAAWGRVAAASLGAPDRRASPV